MLIDIYHGSKDIIKKPIYGYGKTNNDYGLGFYCTKDRELAKEWSVSFDHDGFVNKYQIETNDLKILNLTKYNCLSWLAILIQNREFTIKSEVAIEAKQYLIDNFLIDYQNYDIIYGYRADDSYFDIARSFLNNAIPYNYLNDDLKLGNLGCQYVLKSEKAFNKIFFVEYEKVDKEYYYLRKIIRDEKARERFHKMKHTTIKTNNIYMSDIIYKKDINIDEL